MKLLMHICCGPCTIYPLKELRTYGHDVTGLFYNPNIHPYLEYSRRKQTLQDYAEKILLNVLWPEGYLLEEFLSQVASRSEDRCIYCLTDRLKFTALQAKKENYDAFTSTLLYSRYQKHDLIRQIGETLGLQFGIHFHYDDFRSGWNEGVRISHEMGMYRQPYCGCIYSEKERFYK
jgi:predicted adenine nucleotide alpha hydrolase (AANH) superfamily ATPase